MITVEQLPVDYGDSLLVEWRDDEGRAHRMLIDGGPAHTYDALRRRILALPPDERHLELLVVSHIDCDHIDGAILLLQDARKIGLTIGEVWFNDWNHIQPFTPRDKMGGAEGAILQHVLRDWPVNTRFKHEAVYVPEEGPLPVATLDGGMNLTLLSPDAARLSRLVKRWAEDIRKEGFDPYNPQVDALIEKRRRLGRSDRLGAAKSAGFGRDSSSPNGSSIAFIAEHRKTRVLFAADAFAGVLTKNLRRMGAEPVRLDAAKLSHHGSKANIDADLLAVTDCRRFLISTSGARFDHPDPETLMLLSRQVPDAAVWFNYNTEATTTAWQSRLPAGGSLNATYTTDAIVLPDGEP